MEGLKINYTPLSEAIEILEIDNCKSLSERIYKPPLGETTGKWHLTTLKPGWDTSSGTCLLALMTLP
jgi:hypothetical protein